MSVEAPARPDGSPRPQRGDELELRIDSLAFGGEGVARLGDGGYVVFVAGAIPGDRVRAVVHKRKRSYAHARTLEVLEPGPERIAPTAMHPGVPWQVIPYERQLEIKRGQVDDALRRIGHLDGFELQEIVPALQPWRYRNKLEYSFGEDGDGARPELVCGFHAPAGGNRVTPNGIEAITADGRSVAPSRPAGTRVLDPNIAAMMTRMMAAVVSRGTGRGAALPGRTVVGKTGTTQDSRDAWFIGATGGVVIGVWLGNDDDTPMRGVTGGGLPARLFHDIAAEIRG